MKRWSVCLASSRRRRTSAQQLPCAIGGLCVRVSLYLSRTLNHSLSLLEALSLSLSLSLSDVCAGGACAVGCGPPRAHVLVLYALVGSREGQLAGLATRLAFLAPPDPSPRELLLE